MNAGPVVNQPAVGVPVFQYLGMAHPGELPGVPAGLEYLAAVDNLIIKQEVELLEALTGHEEKNKYRIFNSLNQHVYFAFEESNDCNRICCGSVRGFVLHIIDNQHQEVLNIVREFKCCTGCCWCADGICKFPMIINYRDGRKLGMVRLMNSFYQRHYGIFDENDSPLYEIWAPICGFQNVCRRGDINFPICNINNKSQVGNIRKIWSGYVQEGRTKADTFGVSFPMNLDVKHKALMLGTVFLIQPFYGGFNNSAGLIGQEVSSFRCNLEYSREERDLCEN